VATITNASFVNCMGDIGGGVGCTITVFPTSFPWSITGIDTTRIEIHGDDIDIHFETTPGTLNECANNGLTIRLTGTITISYTPAIRTYDLGGAPGLSAHFPGGITFGAAVRGNATSTGLLNLIM
jgi:hypothetical protein